MPLGFEAQNHTYEHRVILHSGVHLAQHHSPHVHHSFGSLVVVLLLVHAAGIGFIAWLVSRPSEAPKRRAKRAKDLPEFSCGALEQECAPLGEGQRWPSPQAQKLAPDTAPAPQRPAALRQGGLGAFRARMASDDAALARSLKALQPPLPLPFTLFTRVLQWLTLVGILYWTLGLLGGVSFTPKRLGHNQNDTGALFNWHPILMSLAFVIFMGEAVLAYRSPLLPKLSRPQRKQSHAALHSLALLSIALALAAVILSHTQKRPEPTPNFYSPHSYLGLLTVGLFALQFALGLGAYLWPKLPDASRAALVPLHHFLGRAVFALGLANMALGIQEKTGFVVDGKGLSGPQLFTAPVVVPAVTVVLTALAGLAVLYHHSGPAAPSKAPEEQLGGDAEERLLSDA